MPRKARLPEPEWPEIQAQAAGEKNWQAMGSFISGLEKAARKEQEELKLKIRLQVELYRKLTARILRPTG